jgi:hypothetical protein
MNQWTWDQRGLVTLLGWGSLFKGFFGILMPDFSSKIIQKVNLSPMVIYSSGVIMFVIAYYLLFSGFGQ